MSLASQDFSWAEYEALAERIFAKFEGQFRLGSFDYVHPEHLQFGAQSQSRRPYPVRVSYMAWGAPQQPLLICMGGIANVARRFDYLASGLSKDYFVVCPDWLGRGFSGWLQDHGDYRLETYVEQLRQLVRHLGDRPVLLLGSSLGATVAMEFSAMQPGRVARLVLNDTGPYISSATRSSRAQVLARHYVFRTPSEMFRRLGASQKNDGPISDEVRLHNSHAQTRWSQEEQGRVYRHDLRAMLSYQANAENSISQWAAWESIACPVLVTRGMQTTALSMSTLARMQLKTQVTVMHIPATGHTPALAEEGHIACIGDWLNASPTIAGEFSAPYSGLRPHAPA